MDRTQAKVFAKRIQHEEPSIIALPEKEEWVGGQSWVVKILARGSELFLGSIKSLEEWNSLKQHLKLPSSDNK